MKNYQKLYYQHYYAQNAKGEYVPVTRKECFAPGELPTTTNMFKQRWFYDPEAGYAVRLVRNQHGEDIYRTSDSALKNEERQRDRKFQCVYKDTKKCDQDCKCCARTNKSRTVELDKTYFDSEGSECQFDIADEAANIAKIIEDRELLSILFSALDRLAPDDRKLWDFLINKTRKQIIAERFGLTLDGVRYREQRLLKILRSDTALKTIFRKD